MKFQNLARTPRGPILRWRKKGELANVNEVSAERAQRLKNHRRALLLRGRPEVRRGPPRRLRRRCTRRGWMG